jgi:hypothetical protein
MVSIFIQETEIWRTDSRLTPILFIKTVNIAVSEVREFLSRKSRSIESGIQSEAAGES